LVEREAHDVGERFHLLGLDAGGVELLPHVRDVGVGMRHALLEPRELQRGEVRARHGLGRAVEHVGQRVGGARLAHSRSIAEVGDV
jgi:hypothetical protein